MNKIQSLEPAHALYCAVMDPINTNQNFLVFVFLVLILSIHQQNLMLICMGMLRQSQERQMLMIEQFLDAREQPRRKRKSPVEWQSVQSVSKKM
jgi:hypothetical protein